MSERVLLSLWSQHVGWAEAAIRLKARRAWWRMVVLVLSIGGAALQTAAVALENTGLKRMVAAIGAVALLAVAILSGRFLTPSETRKWLRSRSVSEGIQSEIYAYRASAGPYDGEGALEKLRARVGSIVDCAKDLSLEVEMGRVCKSPPPPMNASLYLEHRVARQIERYYQLAKAGGRRAQIFHWIQLALVTLAAVASTLTIVIAERPTQLDSWTAVLTTIVGGVVAYAAGTRYALQATMALASVRELQDLIDGWQASGKTAPSPDWSEFVRACEAVISAESRCWMAKTDQAALALAAHHTSDVSPATRRRRRPARSRHRSMH